MQCQLLFQGQLDLPYLKMYVVSPDLKKWIFMVTMLSSFAPLLNGGRWENSVRVSNLSVNTTHQLKNHPLLFLLFWAEVHTRKWCPPVFMSLLTVIKNVSPTPLLLLLLILQAIVKFRVGVAWNNANKLVELSQNVIYYSLERELFMFSWHDILSTDALQVLSSHTLSVWVWHNCYSDALTALLNSISGRRTLAPGSNIVWRWCVSLV